MGGGEVPFVFLSERFKPCYCIYGKMVGEERGWGVGGGEVLFVLLLERFNCIIALENDGWGGRRGGGVWGEGRSFLCSY